MIPHIVTDSGHPDPPPPQLLLLLLLVLLALASGSAGATAAAAAAGVAAAAGAAGAAGLAGRAFGAGAVGACRSRCTQNVTIQLPSLLTPCRALPLLKTATTASIDYHCWSTKLCSQPPSWMVSGAAGGWCCVRPTASSSVIPLKSTSMAANAACDTTEC